MCVCLPVRWGTWPLHFSQLDLAAVIGIAIVNGGCWGVGGVGGAVLVFPKAVWEQMDGQEKKVTLRTTFQLNGTTGAGGQDADGQIQRTHLTRDKRDLARSTV